MAIGVEDLKVAEPVRPPGPDATLALDCLRRTRLLGRTPALRAASRTGWSCVHPTLLTEPLVVARDDVSVAAVDTRRREGGETLRFPYSHEFEWTQPFPGDEAETYGWLYVRNARSPLPFLSDLQALPNLVVVFRGAARAAQRAAAPQARQPPLPRPPVPAASSPGFFARVMRPGRGPHRAARLGRDAPADRGGRGARRRRVSSAQHAVGRRGSSKQEGTCLLPTADLAYCRCLLLLLRWLAVAEPPATDAGTAPASCS